MSEIVCRNSTENIERIALKGQALAAREGGAECVQNVVMKWKDKGATLKNVESPATHPLN